MTGIEHPYWTSRAGNAVRFALWHRRRTMAAPFLKGIGARHRLGKSAELFEKETELLLELTRLLPPGGDEKAHWDAENEKLAARLLLRARRFHELAIQDLGDAVSGALCDAMTALLKMDADALEREVGASHLLVAEAALARLVELAPSDLDRRLARLWDLPDKAKDLADGPIHRQILFALAKLDGDVATEAIGRAMRFEGKSDTVPHAVARWAAEMYWKRKGKAGREAFLAALDSPAAHVQEIALKYVGKLEDPALLPKLKGRKGAAAAYARALLGEEAAWDELIGMLAEPEWVPAARLLIDAGAPAEARLIPRLKDANGQVVMAAGIVLSRIGTEASRKPLAEAAEAHPEIARLKQAVGDLEKRLKK